MLKGYNKNLVLVTRMFGKHYYLAGRSSFCLKKVASQFKEKLSKYGIILILEKYFCNIIFVRNLEDLKKKKIFYKKIIKTKKYLKPLANKIVLNSTIKFLQKEKKKF